jgi:hypothetical protein
MLGAQVRTEPGQGGKFLSCDPQSAGFSGEALESWVLFACLVPNLLCDFRQVSFPFLYFTYCERLELFLQVKPCVCADWLVLAGICDRRDPGAVSEFRGKTANGDLGAK